ncbi:MAG: DUF3568 domain-containing protein [Gemmataceae bacterium]|nr:DUF3568 domain-containing protein [Gemmataceae bacterium]
MTTSTGHGDAFRVASLILAALALANSGCLLIAAGAAGGAVGYAYSKGKLCQSFPASLQDALAATQTALNDLGMPLVKLEREGDSGFLESRTADGPRVRIYLDVQPCRFPAEGPLTRVCVRVATFGDHPVSARILDQVSVHLAPPGLLPQTFPPAGDVLAPPVVQPVSVPPQTAQPPLAPPEPAKMDKETGSR